METRGQRKKTIYRMILLLISGLLHVINNVMTRRYITLFVITRLFLSLDRIIIAIKLFRVIDFAEYI